MYDSNIKKRLINLISKLVDLNITDIEDLKLHSRRQEYLFFSVFFEDEIINKLDEITYFFKRFIFKFYEKNIENNLSLNIDEYSLLNSMYVIKSLSNEQWESVEKIYSSNDVISKHLTYECKYWMFSIKKFYPHSAEFKTNLFKIYNILAMEKIITEEIEFSLFKKYIKWGIGIKIPSSLFERFNFSFTKFTLCEDDNSFFLISSFFVCTIEIFKKNELSGKKFNFFDKDYLNSILNIGLYFDIEAFEKLYKRIDLSNIDIELRYYKQNEKLKKVRLQYSMIKSDAVAEYQKNVIKNIIHESQYLQKLDENIIYKIFVKKIINNIKNDNLHYNVEDLFTNKDELFKKLSDTSHLIKLNEIKTKLQYTMCEKFVNKNSKLFVNQFKEFDLINEEYKEQYAKEMHKSRIVEEKWKECQKDLSELQSLHTLFQISTFKKRFARQKVFFPISFDFRGRMYIPSRICITELKLSRYFWHYGKYEESEIEHYNSIKVDELSHYMHYSDYILNYFKIKRRDYCIKSSVIWILLSVGKEFIKKNKTSYEISEILEIGKNKLICENDEDDLEKWAIIEHNKRIIISFNSIIYKRFIQKDATASFIQNSIKVIGPKNDLSLEYSNLLRSDIWYDTYTLAKQKWIESLNITNDGIQICGERKLKNKKVPYSFYIDLDKLDFFTRKSIKMPVMVGQYQATYLSKWDYFKDAIPDEDFDFNSDVEILFKSFTEYVDNKFWTDLYLKENSKVLIKEVLLRLNDEITIKSENSSANIIYNKIDKKPREDLEVGLKKPKKRISRTIFKLTNEIDIRKTKTSAVANWIHFADAQYTRDINNELPEKLLTVHDAFFCHPFIVNTFVKVAILSFKKPGEYSLVKNKNEFDKVKSIHIFI